MLICYNGGTIDNTRMFDTFMYFSKEPTCQWVRTNRDSDLLTWLRGKFEGTKLVIIRHTLKEDRQYVQWPKRKEGGQTMQCLSFWPLYCLSSFLSFWPLYCLSSFLSFDNTMAKKKGRRTDNTMAK
jgi:hypothetical protein